LTVVAMVQTLLNKTAAESVRPILTRSMWAAAVLAQARAVPAVRRAY